MKSSNLLVPITFLVSFTFANVNIYGKSVRIVHGSTTLISHGNKGRPLKLGNRRFGIHKFFFQQGLNLALYLDFRILTAIIYCKCTAPSTVSGSVL